MANEIQHPVLLPKSRGIAELIVCYCHEQLAHADQGMTMNQIRSSGFWVTSCNSLVRCIILKCVRCKQLRGRLQQQKMADLPKKRMSEEPPFTYCGVDWFGLFLLKDGQKKVKRVSMIRSDNGSNMVGASTQLTRAFREMDHIKIGNF